MNDADLPHFAALMASLGEIYKKSITEACSETYWESWKPYPWEEVKRSAMRHLLHPERCQFFPLPGDILRYLADTPETQAMKAWSKVHAAMSAVGGYDSVAFDDLLIHTVIRNMGGWSQLCRSKISEAPFLANEFQKRYRSYLDILPQHCPAYLCGNIENEYRQLGLNPPPLVQISECEARVISISYQDPAQSEQTQILLTQLEDHCDLKLKIKSRDELCAALCREEK